MASRLIGLCVVCVAFAVLSRHGPALAKLSGLPNITVCLAIGAMCRAVGWLSADTVEDLRLLHQAALAVITLAAGSELELESLRANYHLVRSLALAMTLSALVVVFVLSMIAMTVVPPGETFNETKAASLLAAVIAIARSPSSAIGIVSELNADGPFTQCVLSVTMVTDVVVVVLFTAAVEIVDATLHPSEALSRIVQRNAPVDAVALEAHSPSDVILRFAGRTGLHLTLSFALGAVLSACCLLLLQLLPSQGQLRHTRPASLCLVGMLAFEAERALHFFAHGSTWDDCLRLEPMLACISAGFALSNWLHQRRAFGALLHGSMPKVLTFFFITVGAGMDFGSLARSWPVACTLFIARLASLRLGCAAGAAFAPQEAPPPVRAHFAWLAYITQAGVGLGLAEETADKFGGWGEALRSSLVATIVLNQLVGPPLLRYALRAAGEEGRKAALPHDKLAEHLTRQLTDPKSISAILSAAASAAKAFPTAVVDAAGTGLVLMKGGRTGGSIFPVGEGK